MLYDNLIYFKIREFNCKCCGENMMNEGFLQTLDRMRGQVDFKWHINSGYRCIKKNASVGGSPTSSHLKGFAVDIKIRNDYQRYAIIDLAIKHGMTRIGAGDSFIHLDVDPDKNPKRLWTY